MRTPPEKAFEPIRRIGGVTGWYCADWLWRLRAAMDVVVGGVGMRGRTDPERLRVGDPVDFWRVEAVEGDRLLRLALELKVPGRGWLEFEVSPDGVGTVIRQTATFEPSGLLGRLYWWAAYPFHALVFAGMLRGIAARGQGRAPGI